MPYSANLAGKARLVNTDTLKSLMLSVQSGEIGIDAAMNMLQGTPLKAGEDTYAHLDITRSDRTGLPEVIYGAGKSAPQIIGILQELVASGHDGIATRVSAEKAAAVLAKLPDVRYHETAQILHWEHNPWKDLGDGKIAVICAGTSDRPVAEEAAVIAEIFGNRVERLTDVGVAGIHRILNRQELLQSARVIIVVAGMEGALASVVAGLTSRPVIAVPTSVGYGAAFGGIAALLAMLNSCASGVSVVNIDNGFGAATQATLINRLK